MSTTIKPEDFHLNYDQKHLRAIVISMFTLAAIFVGLRIFTRLRLQKYFKLDDYLAAYALASYTALLGLLIYGINNGGLGRKTNEVPVAIYSVGAKYLILAQLFYLMTAIVLKLSIAFLQLRIAEIKPVYKYIYYASIGVNIIIGLYEFFQLLFQCFPVARAWDSSISGTCVDREIVARGVYVYSSVNIVLDWLYAILPMPLLWNLQMNTRVKLSVMFVLSLGVFASVATIVRFKFLIGFLDLVNPLYAFKDITIWSVVEVTLGMVAASITTYRPLVAALNFSGFSSRSGRSRSRTNSNGWYSRATGTKGSKAHIRLTDMEAGTTKASFAVDESHITTSQAYSGNDDDNNSDRMILGPDVSGISRTVEVNIVNSPCDPSDPRESITMPPVARRRS